MRLQRYLTEKYYYTAFDEDIYTNPDSRELAKIRENAYTFEQSPYVAAILFGKAAIVFSDNILHSDLIPKLKLNVDKIITIRLQFKTNKAVVITTSDTMQGSDTYGEMGSKEMEDVVRSHPWIKKFQVLKFEDSRNR